MADAKIILVTRKTRLVELVERYNTRPQAKFTITSRGGDFADYEREDDAYRRALERLQRDLSKLGKLHQVDRALTPTMLFGDEDVIVVVGQDGLVANTAKYVGDRPIVGVNPDPTRFDGVLLPWQPTNAASAVERWLAGQANLSAVTLAEASLNDGQRLLAFNDLMIGPQTHTSARYRLTVEDRTEQQSSSGILVATGAGSTGWLSSMFNLAAGLARFAGQATAPPPIRLGWADPRLVYVVREPFASRVSGVSLVAGLVAPGGELTIESLMPTNGVIFSDGVEADYLAFNAGAVARIRAAEQRARLVVH